MTRLASILLAGLLAVELPAATVDFSTLLPTGAPSSLPITLTPLLKLSRSGTNLVAGIPLAIRPTNGPVSLLGGIYTASVSGAGSATLVVPDDNAAYSAAQLATNLVSFLWTNQFPLVSGIIAGSGLTGSTNGGVVTLAGVADGITNGQESVTLSGDFTGTLTGNATGLADATQTGFLTFLPETQRWSGDYGGTFAGTFTGNGSGLTNRPLESALAFGAAGDGSTDDTTAIQTALDRGGLVFLPRGAYKITATLRVPAGGGLVGAGRGASVVMAEIATDNTPSVTGTNMVLRDFAVSSSYVSPTNSAAYSGHVRAIKLGSGCVVSGVGVTNAGTGFEMTAPGVCNVLLQDVTGGNLRNSLGYGEFIHGDSVSNITVRGFAADGMDRGIEFENGARQVLVENGTLKNCYPLGYTGQPWGFYTNYGLTLDTHTHESLGANEQITFRDIHLDTVTRPITCGGAAWSDPVRKALWDNVTATNVIVMSADTAPIDLSYSESVVIRNFQLAPQIINLDYLFRLHEVRDSEICGGRYIGTPRHIADLGNARRVKLVDAYFGQTFIGTLAINRTGNVATVTTDRPHTLTAGQAFGLQGIAASGYNGNSLTVATVTSATNFTFSSTGSDAASTELAGTIFTMAGSTISDAGAENEVSGNTFGNLKNAGAAVIRQEAAGVGGGYSGNRFLFNPGSTTATRARSSNIATVTTATPHGFGTNELAIVTGIGGTGYDTASARILTVPSVTSFTYANSGGNEGSTAATAGTVYRTLGTFNSGTPSYAIRVTGSRATVSENWVRSDYATAAPRLWYVDSVVSGGSQATLSGNRGTWANTSATAIESHAGSSNWVSVANITSPTVWSHASPRYTSLGDVNGTTPANSSLLGSLAASNFVASSGVTVWQTNNVAPTWITNGLFGIWNSNGTPFSVRSAPGSTAQTISPMP